MRRNVVARLMSCRREKLAGLVEVGGGREITSGFIVFPLGVTGMRTQKSRLGGAGRLKEVRRLNLARPEARRGIQVNSDQETAKAPCGAVSAI